MIIDWFTVGAQALNFIVLVWLMKRFLYQPVLDAIDAREKRVGARLAEADGKLASAQKDRDDLQGQKEAFDAQRAGLLTQALKDAEAQGQKRLDAARQAADVLTATRRDADAGEVAAQARAWRQRAQDEVFAIARQTLADLASTSLEASACEQFVKALKTLDGQARDDLAAALSKARDGALVRSAFELPTAQRALLAAALAPAFAPEVVLRYEVAPALVSGIELSAQGQKFAWSIGDYLVSFERAVDELSRPAADAKQLGPPDPVATPRAASVASPVIAESAA